jgi:hypothetical protein
MKDYLTEPKSLVNCLSSLSLQQKEQPQPNSNQQQLKSRSRSVPQFSSLSLPENMSSIRSYMNEMENDNRVSNEKIQESERAQDEESSAASSSEAKEEPKVEFENKSNEFDELKENESDSFKSSMTANNTNNSLMATITPPISPNEVILNEELVNASTTAQASDSLTQNNITDDEKIQSNKSNNQFG